MRVADLYNEPPERFTAARDDLAAELRASDPELASRVARMRKPSVALWVSNQLARREAKDLRAFVEADAGDRALLGRLVKKASAIFEEAGHDPTPAQLRRVEETLLAAPVAPREERAALLEGRLDHPLALGDLDTLLAVAASRRRERAHPRAPLDSGASSRRRGSGRTETARKAEREARRHAARVARETARRLEASAKEAEERARRAAEDAKAARAAAAASAREASRKAAEARKAARRRAA